MQEIWKKIDGFINYQVSNFGRIKSVNKILKPYQNKKNGYMYTHLSQNGCTKVIRIHRLVANAFIPNLENKPYINHIDGNKENNCVDNLEWCTQKENVNWSICNMKHRKNITHTNTNEKYITYRKRNNKYRITIDKKEYKSRDTLEEAIKERNKILNAKI